MREKVVSGSKIPQRVCYERVAHVTIVLRLPSTIAECERTGAVALLTLLRLWSSWCHHSAERVEFRSSPKRVKVLLPLWWDPRHRNRSRTMNHQDPYPEQRMAFKRPFFLVIFFIFIFHSHMTNAQVDVTNTTLGNGLRFLTKDSTFYVQFRLRIQPNFTGTYVDATNSFQEDWSIRRCRAKLDGWVFSPKLVYKLEYDLAGNYIRDAVIKWNFAGQFHLWFGQAKLPGNIQRITSSQTMQLVDRSIMNTQLNLDREMGVQLHHSLLLGNMPLHWALAYSQGDGIRDRGRSTGGEFTARVEAFPLGTFTNNGRTTETDMERERTPKILIGLAYDHNANGFQDRGSWGTVLTETRSLQAFFADITFKYRGIYFLGEYGHKEATDGSPSVFDSAGIRTGAFRTGYGYNLQGGYLFKNNWELAGRYSAFEPEKETGRTPLTESTFGISKYVSGHNLKVQLDFSLLTEQYRPDAYRSRLQVELAF